MQPGSLLYQVTANDVDTAPLLEYTLISNYDSQFVIDRFSGRILLNKALDYERTRRYDLHIQVKYSLVTLFHFQCKGHRQGS